MTERTQLGPAAWGSLEGRVDGWQVRRELQSDGDWLRIEVSGLDGLRGRAWTRAADGLHARLESHLAAAAARRSHEPPPEPADSCLAHGLMATASADLRCQQLGVPLHLWLGGAVRSAVDVKLPVGGSRDLASDVAQAFFAARTFGVRSFALHDAGSDVCRIERTVAALREALGPGCSIAVHLAGQFETPAARALAARLRLSHVSYLADPCASIGECIAATRDNLPALALSVAAYPRAQLVAALPETPPTVLLVDPLLEGGPAAVRALGAIGRVLQVDIGLSAHAGGTWLARLCAVLAAVLPAARHAVELSAGWTPSTLEALQITDGVLALETITTAATAAVAADVLGPAETNPRP